MGIPLKVLLTIIYSSEVLLYDSAMLPLQQYWNPLSNDFGINDLQEVYIPCGTSQVFLHEWWLCPTLRIAMGASVSACQGFEEKMWVFDTCYYCFVFSDMVQEWTGPDWCSVARAVQFSSDELKCDQQHKGLGSSTWIFLCESKSVVPILKTPWWWT